MRKIALLLAFVSLLVSFAYGVVPPKPGTVAPSNFEEFRDAVGRDYTQSGLAQKMQRRFVMVQNGSRDLSDRDTLWLPVVLGRYSDAENTFESEDFEELLFGDNPSGSMQDYYSEVSFNQLTLKGDAAGFYQVSHPQEYYSYESGNWEAAAEFTREVAEYADAVLDYGLYDNDGDDGIPNSGDDDGYVDAFVVVHTGVGAESGDYSQIWSHSSSLDWGGGPYVTQDPSANGGYIRVSNYIMQPERSGLGLIKIGVFCHEFGHALGLPDLYDTDYSTGGVGNFCVMSGGSWGAGGMKPVLMSAWCKYRLGWLDPVEINENAVNMQIPVVRDENFAIKIWDSGQYNNNEYFLIENRMKENFDQELPGDGMLIWHVDDNQWGNEEDWHRLVDLEQADGMFTLNLGESGGGPGDLYPGLTENRAFSPYTVPNSNSYENQNNAISNVGIINISDADTVMEADFYINFPQLESSISFDIQGDQDEFIEETENAIIGYGIEGLMGVCEDLSVVVDYDDQLFIISDDSVFIESVSVGEQVNGNINVVPISPITNAQSTIKVRIFNNYALFLEKEYTVVAGDPITFENDILLLSCGAISTGNEIRGIAMMEEIFDGRENGIWATSIDGIPSIIELGKYRNIVVFSSVTSNHIEDLIPVFEQFYNCGGNLAIFGWKFLSALNNGATSGNFSSNDAEYSVFRQQSFAQQTENDFAGLFSQGGMPELELDPDKISVNWDGRMKYVEKVNVRSGANVLYTFDSYSNASWFEDEVAGYRFQGNADLYYFTFPLYHFTDESAFELGSYLYANFGSINQEQKISKITKPLLSNYPNPFNPVTTINYSLSKSEKVSLKVYNIMGQLVRELISSQDIQPGNHSIVWDGKADTGEEVSSGVYFYKLKAGDTSITKRMILMK